MTRKKTDAIKLALFLIAFLIISSIAAATLEDVVVSFGPKILVQQAGKKDPQLAKILPFLFSPQAAVTGLAQEGLIGKCGTDEKCKKDANTLFEGFGCVQDLSGCAFDKAQKGVLDQLIKDGSLTQEDAAIIGQVQQGYGVLQVLNQPDAKGNLGSVHVDKEQNTIVSDAKGNEILEIPQELEVQPVEDKRNGETGFSGEVKEEESKVEIASTCPSIKGPGKSAISGAAVAGSKKAENGMCTAFGGEKGTKFSFREAGKNIAKLDCSGKCAIDLGKDAGLLKTDKLSIIQAEFEVIEKDGKKEYLPKKVSGVAAEDTIVKIGEKEINLAKGESFSYGVDKTGKEVVRVNVDEQGRNIQSSIKSAKGEVKKPACFKSIIGEACGNFVIEMKNGDVTSIELNKGAFYNHALPDGIVQFYGDEKIKLYSEGLCVLNKDCTAEISGAIINVRGDLNVKGINLEGKDNGFGVKLREGSIYEFSLPNEGEDIADMLVSGQTTFIRSKDNEIRSGIKIGDTYEEWIRIGDDLKLQGNLAEKMEDLQEEYNSIISKISSGQMPASKEEEAEIEKLRKKAEDIDTWLKSPEVAEDIKKQMSMAVLMDSKSLARVRGAVLEQAKTGSQVGYKNRDLYEEVYDNLLIVSSMKELKRQGMEAESAEKFLPISNFKFRYEDSGKDPYYLWQAADSMDKLKPELKKLSIKDQALFLENYADAQRNIIMSKLAAASNLELVDAINPFTSSQTETLLTIWDLRSGKIGKMPGLISDIDRINAEIREIKSDAEGNWLLNMGLPDESLQSRINNLNLELTSINDRLIELIPRPTVARTLGIALSDIILPDIAGAAGLAAGGIKTLGAFDRIDGIRSAIHLAEISGNVQEANRLKKVLDRVYSSEKSIEALASSRAGVSIVDEVTVAPLALEGKPLNVRLFVLDTGETYLQKGNDIFWANVNSGVFKKMDHKLVGAERFAEGKPSEGLLFDAESVRVGDHLLLEHGIGDISTRQVSKIITADSPDKVIDFFTGLDDSLARTIARTEQREAYLQAIKGEIAHDKEALFNFDKQSKIWTNEQLIGNAEIFLADKPDVLVGLSRKYPYVAGESKLNIIDQIAGKKLAELQDASNLPKEEWEEGLESILDPIVTREIEKYSLEGIAFGERALLPTKREAYLNAMETKYASDPTQLQKFREDSKQWDTFEVVARAESALKDEPKLLIGLKNIYLPAQKLEPASARDIYANIFGIEDPATLDRLRRSDQFVGEGYEGLVVRVPDEIKKQYGIIADQDVVIKANTGMPSKILPLKAQAEILDILESRGAAPRIFGSGNKFYVAEEIQGVVFATLPRKQARTFRSKFQELTDILVEEGIKLTDLHAENVMVTREGKLKIIDVGFASRSTNRAELRSFYQRELASLVPK